MRNEKERGWLTRLRLRMRNEKERGWLRNKIGWQRKKRLYLYLYLRLRRLRLRLCRPVQPRSTGQVAA
jgi:hypothetical protein